MTFQPGDLILNSKYRVEALVGRGAFGEVYRVTHVRLGSPRAAKVLRRDAPGVGSTRFNDCRQRFELEAKLGDKLDHPNVIKVSDFEEEGDSLILVMEYVPVGSLAQPIEQARKSNQTIPIDEAVRIAIDVAEGLAAIHAMDVVHRDLKPSNILFDAQGRAKVGDLGLAQVPGGSFGRSLGVGQPHPGTAEYMSPEQEHTTGRLAPPSDIYALGVVLFEMLTGRLYKNLRPGTRLLDLRPEVPVWLDDLLMRMLSDDASKRPWDGSEAGRLLHEGETEAKRKQEEERRRFLAEQHKREEAEAKAKREAEARAREEEKKKEAELARQREEARAKRGAEERSRRQTEAEAQEKVRRRQEIEQLERQRKETEERNRRAAARTAIAQPDTPRKRDARTRSATSQRFWSLPGSPFPFGEPDAEAWRSFVSGVQPNKGWLSLWQKAWATIKPEGARKYLQLADAGYRAYQKQRYRKAIKLWERVLQEYPDLRAGDQRLEDLLVTARKARRFYWESTLEDNIQFHGAVLAFIGAPGLVISLRIHKYMQSGGHLAVFHGAVAVAAGLSVAWWFISKRKMDDVWDWALLFTIVAVVEAGVAATLGVFI